MQHCGTATTRRLWESGPAAPRSPPQIGQRTARALVTTPACWSGSNEPCHLLDQRRDPLDRLLITVDRPARRPGWLAQQGLTATGPPHITPQGSQVSAGETSASRFHGARSLSQGRTCPVWGTVLPALHGCGACRPLDPGQGSEGPRVVRRRGPGMDGASLVNGIDVAAVKEQLLLLGHNVPDNLVVSFLRGLSLDGDDAGALRAERRCARPVGACCHCCLHARPARASSLERPPLALWWRHRTGRRACRCRGAVVASSPVPCRHLLALTLWGWPTLQMCLRPTRGPHREVRGQLGSPGHG